MDKNSNSLICIIHVYFGKLPNWFLYFIECCKSNKNVNFLIFTDQKSLPNLPHNISWKHIFFNEFKTLIKNSFEINPLFNHAYKICDFKPAFGLLFQEYLKEYEFWGYCDNDLIFGDIKDFVNETMLKNYDIISFYKGFLSGPFCLFRNKEEINSLFKKNRSYKTILSDKKHFAFDENIQRKELKGISLDKIFFGMVFYLKNLIGRKLQYKTHRELRYQFQLEYKKRRMEINSPKDMTEIVWSLQKQNIIRASFRELLLSDSYFYRIKRMNWTIVWKDGVVLDVKNKQKIFGFHFSQLKNCDKFFVNKYNNEQTFLITEKGISIG